MTVKTIGSAIAFACAVVTTGAAQAIEVAQGGAIGGPAFTGSDGKDRDGVNPWHVYFDPACDSVAVPEMTFNTTAYGAKPSGNEREKSHAAFGRDSKGDGGDYTPRHEFGKSEKFDVSNFHGYKDHSQWKPDYDYCTPIPEPQTYALLIAGLGLMTVVARRRKAATN